MKVDLGMDGKELFTYCAIMHKFNILDVCGRNTHYLLILEGGKHVFFIANKYPNPATVLWIGFALKEKGVREYVDEYL